MWRRGACGSFAAQCGEAAEARSIAQRTNTTNTIMTCICIYHQHRCASHHSHRRRSPLSPYPIRSFVPLRNSHHEVSSRQQQPPSHRIAPPANAPQCNAYHRRMGNTTPTLTHSLPLRPRASSFSLFSKLSSDTLAEAVQAVLKNSTEKKRNFTETIELQVALKNYDSAKDKRFAGVVRLPIAPKNKFTVCIIGDAKDIERAKVAGIPSMSQDDLKKLKKDKKLVKKLANSYDCFLASATLIRMIPRLLGPGLNKVRRRN